MSESVVSLDTLTSAADQRTPKQRQLARLRTLERLARGFVLQWSEIAEHNLPGSVRVRDNGRKDVAATAGQSLEVVNSIGVIACRTLASGMMSGLTSPARIWFALAIPDTDRMRFGPVKSWLHKVQEAMFRQFARSNLYQVLPLLYAHLGAFGVACALLEKDVQDLIRFYLWTPGTYFLANSGRLTVDTAYRRLSLTVAQLVQQFGQENCSRRVQQLWAQKQYDQDIEVIRAIEPNMERAHGKLDRSGAAVLSDWFEPGSGDERDKYLRRSFYRQSPILAPRWGAIGEDVYSRSPGFDALPDSRMVQQYERRNGQVVDYLAAPPVASSAQLQGAYPMPGEVLKVPFSGTQNAIQTIHQTQPAAITAIDTRVQRLENRINEIWFANLWLMLSQDDRNMRPTAREVAERHEEKLLQLGPTLVRVYNELLDPTIERTFALMVEASMPFWQRQEDGPFFPPPPEELAGQDLRVEYISPLALAQRLVGITSDERLAGFVGNIAAVKPDIIDKVDWDRMVEGYAERTSANPDVVVPQDKVEQIRGRRSQQQQQQQQVTEQIPAAAQAAKVLSETDIRGDSALNRLLYAQAGGAGVPPALPGAGRGG